MGNLIEEKIYTRGSCEQIRTFQYDVSNKIIENKWFLNGNLIESVTYKYDNRGNLIESDAGNTVLETNKYNSNNKLIEKKISVMANYFQQSLTNMMNGTTLLRKLQSSPQLVT